MHRVLQIPEVLLNIFCHLVPSVLSDDARNSINADLLALATTCRTFKEPALDILWSELHDPSPLECLPVASERPRLGFRFPIARKTAPPMRRPTRHVPSSTRQTRSQSRATTPKQAGWDILYSYTRRVWSLSDLNFDEEFDWELFRTSVDRAPAKPLFPNLRSLRCNVVDGTVDLLSLPFPSLTRLDIGLALSDDLCIIEEPLKSLAKTSPNVKKLDVFSEDWVLDYSKEPEYIGILSRAICGWSNLQSVTCPQIPLNMDAFVHLSHISSLTHLAFTPSDTLLDSKAPSDPLSFSVLNGLKMHAETLASVSKLLSWIRLPSVMDFSVNVNTCPSKQDLTLFMARIQILGMSQTIRAFSLNQAPDDTEAIRFREPDAPLLDLDDLRSCMAFYHLRRMHIDLEWDVNLSDNELLMLGSAWPWLEELLINTKLGWNRPGITPNGFAALLETCPSLSSIALVISTQGDTQMLPRQYREPISPSTFKRPFQLNVLDSVIKRGSVDTMAAFLASIMPHFDFVLTAWEAEWSALDDTELDLYRQRWADVHSQANEAIKRRWLNILCGMFFPS